MLRSRLGWLGALALLPVVWVWGCAGDGGTTSQAGGSVGAGPAASTLEATGTAAANADWHDLFDQGAAQAEATATPVGSEGFPAVTLEPMFNGQTFERITALDQDASGAWYVVEQIGRIQRLASDTAEPELWLDLTDAVDYDRNEAGLVGFVLAPDFEDSGEFYVSYTNARSSVLSRFTAVGGAVAVDSEQRLLTLTRPSGRHNGGQLAFGPDGYLYMGIGDGGTPGDRLNLGQNLGFLFGKILRLDVSGSGANYAVPDDNPFVGQDGKLGEIWAYGFRNPWRFSFDSATGDLWAGDVGEGRWEEVELVEAGANYGWRVMEGSQCREGPTCNSDGMTPPTYDYPHDATHCAVIGGYVYRGSAIPALQGAYVFTDLCSGVLTALRVEDGEVDAVAEIAVTDLLSSSFAEDAAGELYLLELATEGRVYRFVAK